MRYPVAQELSLPGLASERDQDLSLSELRKRGCRVIGGDMGDLEFQGYVRHMEGNKTILCNPVLIFGEDEVETLTTDEVFGCAQEIILASYASIGLETLEHS